MQDNSSNSPPPNTSPQQGVAEVGSQPQKPLSAPPGWEDSADYNRKVLIYGVLFLLFFTAFAGYLAVRNILIKRAYPETSQISDGKKELMFPSEADDKPSELKFDSSAYSFSYPADWELITNEAGSLNGLSEHVLTNYSLSEVERNLSFGEINWKNFMGDNPSVRIDMIISTDLLLVQEEIDDIERFSIKTSTNGPAIGGWETTMYLLLEDDGENFVFVAYPDEETVIRVTLKMRNLTQGGPEDHFEWEDIELFLESFVFK